MVSVSHVFRKSKTLWLAGLLVIAMLALTACQPSVGTNQTPVGETQPAVVPTSTTAAPAPTDAPASTATMATIPDTSSGEAELNVVNDPDLGEILVGNEGMTLYMFTQDEPNISNCEGGCLANWPPLVTQGNPTLGAGVDPDLVGTADLPDGRKIGTYNSMPLYYWANDIQAGDTTGQGVGDVWYVVSPEGEVIGMDSPAVESTATSAPAASSMDEAELSVVNDPTFGEILVGNDGMTLYIFTNDLPNQSNCTGGCLENWPPLVTDGSPLLGEGIDPDLVGTADLTDGRKIVTYNEMPLYYWANDRNPGDTTGQGVGNVWYVISPEGNVIGQ
jgi:predicted lipoprotein with Yx(FWY)xxD motif